MDQPTTEYQSDLVDLTSASLGEVMALDTSVLGHALRRLWQEADLPDELVAGHSNSI